MRNRETEDVVLSFSEEEEEGRGRGKLPSPQSSGRERTGASKAGSDSATAPSPFGWPGLAAVFSQLPEACRGGRGGREWREAISCRWRCSSKRKQRSVLMPRPRRSRLRNVRYVQRTKTTNVPQTNLLHRGSDVGRRPNAPVTLEGTPEPTPNDSKGEAEYTRRHPAPKHKHPTGYRRYTIVGRWEFRAR